MLLCKFENITWRKDDRNIELGGYPIDKLELFGVDN
jgi:hypothetical protein